MNKLKFILILLILSFFTELMYGQVSKKHHFLPWKKEAQKTNKAFKNPEKAKKQQEAKQKKMDKDYALFVKKSKKHAFEIQSPEVKARMKQNEKDTKAYYKSKGKKQSSGTKKGRKKYS